MNEKTQTITAFEISKQDDMPIEPAPVEREWMEEKRRFAYRCLPLTIANQCGWIIRNPTSFTAFWNGGSEISDLKVDFNDKPSVGKNASLEDNYGSSVVTVSASLSESNSESSDSNREDTRISSHFGFGVVTFSLPCLFRTPRGVNLWVGDVQRT